MPKVHEGSRKTETCFAKPLCTMSRAKSSSSSCRRGYRNCKNHPSRIFEKTPQHKAKVLESNGKPEESLKLHSRGRLMAIDVGM